MSGLVKAYDEFKELMQLSERVASCANDFARLERLVDKKFDRLEEKLEAILLRLKEVEINQANMREGIRNEILSEVRAEVATVKTVIGLLPDLRVRLGVTMQEDGNPRLIKGPEHEVT